MKKNRLLTVITFILLSLNLCLAISPSKINKEEDFKVVGFHLDLRI